MRVDSFDDVVLRNSLSTDEDSFVGLRFEDNKVVVTFPIGYDIPVSTAERKKSVFSLLRILFIANRNNAGMYDIYGFSDDSISQAPFDSFMWLIKDYYSNGLYRSRMKVYRNSLQGKINWKKTLSNGGMLFQILPPERTVSSRYVNAETLLTEIHCFCINESLKYLGWLYNIEPIRMQSHHSTHLYIKTVRKAMEHTFNDRVFALLSNMLKILTFMQSDNNNIKTVGTNHFEYIWEMIVDDLFGNVNITEFFPSAVWHLDYNRVEHKDTHLRPDTIYKTEDSLYVLDAKYYKYGITLKPLHLPHTDSIQKQITYGDHIANNHNRYKIEPDSIYNAFVLPFSKHDSVFEKKGALVGVGFAESDWRNKEMTKYPYENIVLLLLDTKEAMDMYIRDSSNDSELLRDALRDEIKGKNTDDVLFY